MLFIKGITSYVEKCLLILPSLNFKNKSTSLAQSDLAAAAATSTLTFPTCKTVICTVEKWLKILTVSPPWSKQLFGSS